jgi:hypothetical protein
MPDNKKADNFLSITEVISSIKRYRFFREMFYPKIKEQVLPASPAALAAISAAAASAAAAVTAFSSLLLFRFSAGRAPLRLVFEPFFFVKRLLTFGKYEFIPTVFAH